MNKQITFILAGVSFVIFFVILAFVFWSNGGNRPKGPDPVVDVDHIAQLRNRGLAELENGKYEASDPFFEELETLLPEELLPLRNLAVSRVLRVQTMKRDDDVAFEKAQALAEETLKRLEAVDDSGVPSLLRGKMLMSVGDFTNATEAFSTAYDLSPDDGSAAYEFFAVTELSRDDALVERGREALRQAYKHEPDNLLVMLQWLITLADREDAEFGATLDSMASRFNDLADGIKKRTRADIRDFVSGAQAAAKDQDWPIVKRNVRILFNVTNPDDATKSDRRIMVQHPLEYVMIDFDSGLDEKIRALDTKVPSIEMAFTTQSLQTGIDGAMDAMFVDVNLDLRSELAVRNEAGVHLFEWKSERDLSREDQPSSLGGAPSIENPDDRKSTLLATIPLQNGSEVTGVQFADLDNDGNDALLMNIENSERRQTADLECIAFGADGLQLFEATLESLGGNVTYKPMEVKDDALAELRNITHLTVSDLNNDGDLDFAIIANGVLTLWSNRADGTFDTMPIGEIDAQPVSTMAVDWNRDVNIDLIVMMADGTFRQLENLRHGTFRWIEFPVPGGKVTPRHFEIADIDNSSTWDLILAGPEGLEVAFTRDVGDGIAFRDERELISETAADSFELCDYDNDGTLDFIVRSGAEVHAVSWNHAEVPMVENRDSEPENAAPALKTHFSSIWVDDFDGDGDLDAVTSQAGSVMLLENMGGNQNHFIRVGLLAEQITRDGTTESGRVNHFGIGSVLEFRAGGNYQKRLVRSSQTHFGLGNREQVDAVRILWPNGIPDNAIEPEVDQQFCEIQKLKGSCPYLYTWDGEKYVFVTDLLWASPIGLQNANGELVPARPWENLFIPGEMLAMDNGEYRLQITEELWEAAYFDHVSLIAVDHPEEIEIVTNEKVGPPIMAEHKLFSLHEPRVPKSVTDHRGNDLLPLVKERDEEYAKPFHQKIRQGYTEDGWMEIDFGLTEKPELLMLYLTGWIYPTDTSINAALHENPSLPGPRPPSILVPNENGEFVEVVPFMGFPGGKTKTIAVDLSSIFLTDDYRIRIATSSELYWDRIVFTVDEASIEFREVPLTMLSADLHYRGVSKKITHPQFGPERYDYHSVLTAPAWPPMEGGFTRYGDVFDLINAEDDRMAILGSGDEITIRFQAPESELPTGWKRDFILHNIGWDKDADLHTVYGSSVEPLPFRGMKSYPYGTDEVHPKPDQRLFHTRKLDPHRFHRDVKQQMKP